MPHPLIPKLAVEGNYKLENFSTAEDGQARSAVREVKELARLINVAVIPASLAGTKIAVRGALADWFGVSSDPAYNKLKGLLGRLNMATLAAQVTLVYRPNISVKDAAGQQAFLGDGTAFTGDNVYGYIHHHAGGSGYRVVCGRLFITDHTPYFASTTIYHELSHKVLTTRDLGYGEVNCKNYAQQGTAMENADNYAYFAIAIGKARARL